MNTPQIKSASVVSWLIAAWIGFVFLASLPYKFTLHPDTQHIFGTIGTWLSGFLGDGIGGLFSNFGSYAVGAAELLACLILLAPALIWVFRRSSGKPFGNTRRQFHQIGGLLSSAIMAGAVFFHLATPLGVEVMHNGQSDGGNLFYKAVSILVLGIVLFLINRIHKAATP